MPHLHTGNTFSTNSHSDNDCASSRTTFIPLTQWVQLETPELNIRVISQRSHYCCGQNCMIQGKVRAVAPCTLNRKFCGGGNPSTTPLLPHQQVSALALLMLHLLRCLLTNKRWLLHPRQKTRLIILTQSTCPLQNVFWEELTVSQEMMLIGSCSRWYGFTLRCKGSVHDTTCYVLYLGVPRVMKDDGRVWMIP
jgi:hypothetical protein